MVQGQMTQTYEDHCIYSDSHWFCKSFSFSHSVKPTGIDHTAVLADSNQFQTCLRITENHQESPRINFRLIWELPRSLWINENQFQTYSRITENHWESLWINFRLIQESLRITKNQWESISDVFENHQESHRINFRLIWESPRIAENQWESLSDWSENQQESSRIIENHWESHKK